MVKLILFDIDGTLIRTGGAGVKAFEQTFAEVFGLPEATGGVCFSGRTDVSIVREVFGKLSVEPSGANFGRFFEAYPSFLEQLLRVLPGGVCEGIEPFMQELFALPDRPIVGLLTGNIRRGAELKLRRYNLWDKFATGAFADDHEDRNGIAAMAKKRGEEILGRTLSGEEIVVIGDTPRDVSCAQSIGAKALAVATGIHPLAELALSNPTWHIPHLGEVTVTEVLGRTGVR